MDYQVKVPISNFYFDIITGFSQEFGRQDSGVMGKSVNCHLYLTNYTRFLEGIHGRHRRLC